MQAGGWAHMREMAAACMSVRSSAWYTFSGSVERSTLQNVARREPSATRALPTCRCSNSGGTLAWLCHRRIAVIQRSSGCSVGEVCQ